VRLDEPRWWWPLTSPRPEWGRPGHCSGVKGAGRLFGAVPSGVDGGDATVVVEGSNGWDGDGDE